MAEQLSEYGLAGGAAGRVVAEPAQAFGPYPSGARVPGARVPGARVPGARMPGARMPRARVRGRRPWPVMDRVTWTDGVRIGDGTLGLRSLHLRYGTVARRSGPPGRGHDGQPPPESDGRGGLARGADIGGPDIDGG